MKCTIADADFDTISVEPSGDKLVEVSVKQDDQESVVRLNQKQVEELASALAYAYCDQFEDGLL